MARAGVERRQARREDRRARREFGEVARDAIRKGVQDGTLDQAKGEALIAATNRPAQLEQIRAAFIQDVSEQRGGPQQLQAADVLGKIDFDSLFGLLVPFFPKLATVAKFAPLFKAILSAFRGMRSGAAS